MIYRVNVTPDYWLTLVVRAASKERARALALECARQYDPGAEVQVEVLDPNGPEGGLVEDAS